MPKDRIPRLRTELRDLVRDCGAPSLSELLAASSRLGDPLPKSTTSDLLKAGAFREPRWPTVLALVAACAWFSEHGRKDRVAHQTLVDSGRFDPARWYQLYAQEIDREQADAAPAYDATVRAIHQRTGPLRGRRADLEAIAAFATGEAGYRRIVAEPWAGKTALLAAAAVDFLRQKATGTGTVDAICCFLSRLSGTATSTQFLEIVLPQLRWLVDGAWQENTASGNAPGVEFADLWDRAAARAQKKGRHLLLMVDGLDEDRWPPGTVSVAASLPVRVGPQAHVLVAGRSTLEMPSDIADGHPLLGTEPQQLAPFEGAQELARLAQQEMDDLVDAGGPAADVLAMLTAASGPLTVADLAVLIHGEDPAPSRITEIRTVVTRQAARSLAPAVSGEGARRFFFAHLSLLTYAQSREDLGSVAVWRRIVRWAATWSGRQWRGAPGELVPRYLLEFYPVELAERQDLPALTSLAGDPDWVCAAVTTTGVDTVQQHLQVLTAARILDAPIRTIAAVLAAQRINLCYTYAQHERYVIGQLLLEAEAGGETALAARLRARQRASSEPSWHLAWADQPRMPRPVAELGLYGAAVGHIVVLPSGLVVTASSSGKVLVWDPNRPDIPPAQPSQDYDELDVVFTAYGQAITFGPGNEKRVLEHPLHGLTAIVAIASNLLLSSHYREQRRGYISEFFVWRAGYDPALLGSVDHRVTAMTVLSDQTVVLAMDDGALALLTGVAEATVPQPQQGGTDPEQPTKAPNVPADTSAATERPSGMAKPHLYVPVVWSAVVHSLAVLSDDRVVCGFDYPLSGYAAVLDLSSHDDDGELTVSAVDGRVSVAALPDDRVVLTGLSGGVAAWDLHTPDEPTSVPYDGGTDLAALPDGRFVTSAADGKVMVWDPDQLAVGPALVCDLNDRGPTVAALPDGRVITGGRGRSDGRVQLWQPPSRDERGQRDATAAPVWCLAFLPDGALVTGDATGLVRIRDRDASDRLVVQTGAKIVKLLPFSDGALVVVTTDGVVRCDLISGEQHRIVLPGFEGPRDAVLLSVDQLVTNHWVNGIRLYDLAHPEQEPMLLRPANGPESTDALAVTTDGRLLTGSNDGVQVWERTEPGADRPIADLLGHWVHAMAVMTDGRIATTSRSGIGSGLVIWPAPQTDGEAESPVGFFPKWGLADVAPLSDARLVTTGWRDNMINIVDPAGRYPVEAIATAAEAVVATTVADGTDLVAALGPDGGVAIWTYQGGTPPP